MKNLLTWIIFVVAALLEVSGDALIRKGLRSSAIAFIAGGFIILGVYGLVVNIVKWDFSRLLGIYVAVFAVISILFARYFFQESISTATWVGMAIIVICGLVIQFG